MGEFADKEKHRMNNKIELTFEAIAIKDNVGYASDYDSNSLFRVDMETGECTFIRLFDDEPFDVKRLHSAAVWIDNKIYFIPLAGEKISVFNITDNSMQSIQIPLPDRKKYSYYKERFKFVRAVKNRNYLWVVPATYPGVLRLDLQTNKVKVFDKWVPDKKYMFLLGLCIKDDRFFIPDGRSNMMLIFDMEKEVGQVEHIGSNNRGIIDMCEVNGTYWLAPSYEGPIISWNPELGDITEYSAYPSDFKGGRIVFANNYCYKDEIIFLPANANYGVVLTNGELEIEESQQWKETFENRLEYLFETDLHRYYRELNKEKISRFYKINKMDNSLSIYSFFYFENGKRIKSWVESMNVNCKVIRENSNICLTDFIQEILK